MGRVEQLCLERSDALAIRLDTPATEIVALFQARPALRLLPVLDAAGAPLGALYECDIRAILFHPFGYALLVNPGAGAALAERMRPCLAVDVATPLPDLLSLFARAGGGEGVIVLRDGRYAGLIESARLIEAAGRIEIQRMRAREAALDRMRAVGTAFQGEIDALARGLQGTSRGLADAAAETVQRGTAIAHHAREVAAAAGQGDAAAGLLADGAGALADALDALHADAAQAGAAAERAVALAAEGRQRTEALLGSTASIERITQTIDALAARVRMLAINATIEAARAGEAGRGFGIVAAEVRDLARQTRASAEQIGHHARDVRAAVAQVADGHHGMAAVIEGLDRIAQGVARTVALQRTVTREIAGGAEQTAQASRGIRASAEAIHRSAETALGGAQRIGDAAEALARSSHLLGARVDAFIADIAPPAG